MLKRIQGLFRRWSDRDELSFAQEVERELDDVVKQYSELRFGGPESLISPMKNNLGIDLKEAGHLDEAEKMFLDAIEADPNCIDACRNLGVLYLEQGRRAEARKMFKKAKRLDEELPKYVLLSEKRASFRELFRDSVEATVRERRRKKRRGT